MVLLLKTVYLGRSEPESAETQQRYLGILKVHKDCVIERIGLCGNAVKTWFYVQVSSSRRTHTQKFHHSVISQNLFCVISDSDFFFLHSSQRQCSSLRGIFSPAAFGVFQSCDITAFLWSTSAFSSEKHMYDFFSMWICISLQNMLVCININVSISSRLKYFKAGKGKAICFI